MFNELTKSKHYDSHNSFSLKKIKRNIEKYLQLKNIIINIEDNSLTHIKNNEYFKFNDSEAFYSKDDKSIIYNLHTFNFSGNLDLLESFKKNKLSTYLSIENEQANIPIIKEKEFTLEENFKYLVNYINKVKCIFEYEEKNDLSLTIQDWKKIYESYYLKNFHIEYSIGCVTLINSINDLNLNNIYSNIFKNIHLKNLEGPSSLSLIQKNNKSYKIEFKISDEMSLCLYNKNIIYLEFFLKDQPKISKQITLFKNDLIKENKCYKSLISNNLEKINESLAVIFEIGELISLLQPKEDNFYLDEEIVDLYLLNSDINLPNIENILKIKKNDSLKNKI